MKTIEYRDVIDKATWPRGPWDNEPDKKQWQDEATGLPCMTKRHPQSGNLCGYVGVPAGHPAHGKECGAVDVEVHGGLTYSDSCEADGREPCKSICHVVEHGEPDSAWWLGFDCHHAWDVAPGSVDFGPYPGSNYRTQKYVESECRSLAAQLAAMKGV